MRSFRHVLVVDDSSTSRMIMQRCVEMAGVKVDAWSFAENGIEAMSSLKAGAGIDLVITDINMPKMDGETFARLVKQGEATRDIPVIVVSSIATDAAEAQLTALGVLAVVRKPLSPAKIAQALGGER